MFSGLEDRFKDGSARANGRRDFITGKGVKLVEEQREDLTEEADEGELLFIEARALQQGAKRVTGIKYDMFLLLFYLVKCFHVQEKDLENCVQGQQYNHQGTTVPKLRPQNMHEFSRFLKCPLLQNHLSPSR